VIELVDVYGICFEQLTFSIQPSMRFSMTSKTTVRFLTAGQIIDGCCENIELFASLKLIHIRGKQGER